MENKRKLNNKTDMFLLLKGQSFTCNILIFGISGKKQVFKYYFN